MDDANHFIGEYAFEMTPHWTMFTITSSGTTFALKAMGQFHMGDFELHDSELTGIVDGSPTCLSREEGSGRYILRGEARKRWPKGSTETMPVAFTLVKRLPSPGSTWEEKFGVTAADLVRHVRESEQWIHQFESLHLAANVTATTTPEGMEHYRKDLKTRFPNEDATLEKFLDLPLSHEGREELYIDRRRFRHSTTRKHNREESIDTWDGQTRMTYHRNDTFDQEQQGIAPDLGRHGASLLSGFAWPRAQRHTFWWMGHAPDRIGEGDPFGRPEDFVLMGRQDYRGVPCYVLECRPRMGDVDRWFVCVEDGLLRGNLSYGLALRREFWMDQYEEIEPGCWFPMRQGYHHFEDNPGQRAFLSSSRDVIVTEIAMNEEFPDDLFRIALKEGVRTCDHRVDGIATYAYRKDMTEEEWEQIRAEARKRAEDDAKRPPTTH